MKAGEYSEITAADRLHNGRAASPPLTLFARRLIKTTMRSERGGVSQVSLCRCAHTHTCAWQPQPLSSLAWRREGACGRTHKQHIRAHTHALVHRLQRSAVLVGALTSYRMCACLRTALISARCTATAAKRPQCGCDTCHGEEAGGGEGERESWLNKQ